MEDGKGEIVYVPQSRFLKPLILGLDQFVSSFYWLKTVQYIGDNYWSKKGYPDLFQMIDLVTDLSPKFDYPYQTGGVILSNYVHRIEESNAILEKGMKENPKVWQIPFYLGFNHFFYLNDYQNAGKYMEAAAKISGSPAYLPLLVSRLYAQANNPETALEFLQRVYENTSDAKVKEEIIKRIKEVVVERDIFFIEKGLNIFHNIYGTYPDDLGKLVSSHVINKIPDEPFGGYYYIDGNHEVKSSIRNNRLRVYKK